MIPRLLKLKDAAEYCGLPPRNFARNVGVKPIRLGPHSLWDRADLDAYIESLKGNSGNPEKWSDAVAKF